jgi:Acyl-protein synthetase, LuxE
MFQHNNNTIYNKWCNAIGFDSQVITNIYENEKLLPLDTFNLLATTIPYLPIGFFKTHKVVSTSFKETILFESSGTTTSINSKHYIKDANLYNQSFLTHFTACYGNPKNLCIIGLLPSYLERKNSSLVYMVDSLIAISTHKSSGFYLYNFDELAVVLQQQEAKKQPTILFGVTFALLDFAQIYKLNLQHTTIIETGGMKGRKQEITKQQVHQELSKSFNLAAINSEYGMTELLSQAYATTTSQHICPNWMKAVVRQQDDPMSVSLAGKGLLNIIDLANVYSCSFIATDDVAIVNKNGSFEVLGRLDNSDLRGCSLLTV